jgi:hypothetical protein
MSFALEKYSYNDQTKTDEMSREWGMHENEQKFYKAFVGKPEGNRPLGRPRHRWEYNMKFKGI